MDNLIKFFEQKKNITKEECDVLERQIKTLFDDIVDTSSISEADNLFSELERIQFILAKIQFKEGNKLTPFLTKFVHDFDRIDDNTIRHYIYNDLKGI